MVGACMLAVSVVHEAVRRSRTPSPLWWQPGRMNTPARACSGAEGLVATSDSETAWANLDRLSRQLGRGCVVGAFLAQQSAYRPTCPFGPQHLTGRARSNHLWPPEPTSEHRGDGGSHERAHDQGVE